MAGLPSELYAAGVARGDWQDDPAQRAVLVELDRLHAALGTAQGSTGLLGRLFGRDEASATRGLYLWGGVGRGKTFLVDLFYDSLDFPQKQRAHFHRFMREIHAQLKAHAGERDPLAAIAKQWRREMRVLVLDEFFVTDIGDAMLLSRLLERLFAEGVVLVTTSNTVPANLYKDGLQRARFLPAIALIERHCVVMEIASSTDYRLRELTRSPVYRVPADDAGDAWLSGRWQTLTHVAPKAGELQVDGRPIRVRARCHGFAWFDFDALCEGPRAAADYIEIAHEFHTVLLGGIPRFDGGNDDAARRFVTAIDEFYDRHVNLVCTAAASPVELYAGERLAHAFERTASRLIEMQSAEYLASEHLT
ncbi:cell division protein ZapE [Lysobacter oculi]|uniref:Cell division protein ZapE n=1 Tax=Solilutibacter oculi TaxID=2698682 RepID=A0A344J7X2_9GAMM|nr:cell division protein ZapE [Lysobacter oculi]AXA85132.1 cell division protein ZapE [Lysobacter oculi]